MKTATTAVLVFACLGLCGCASESSRSGDGNSTTQPATAPAAATTGPAAHAGAQKIVDGIVAKHPEIVRLTIHAVPTGQIDSRIIACNLAEKVGQVSDPEDVEAMKTGKTTVLVEGENLDVTAPVVDASGKAIAATGITLKGAVGATTKPATATTKPTERRWIFKGGKWVPMESPSTGVATVPDPAGRAELVEKAKAIARELTAAVQAADKPLW